MADLCSAYVFLARYNLKNRNLEAAEMYAHKCCEFNEVCFSSPFLIQQSICLTVILSLVRSFLPLLLPTFLNPFLSPFSSHSLLHIPPPLDLPSFLWLSSSSLFSFLAPFLLSTLFPPFQPAPLLLFNLSPPSFPPCFLPPFHPSPSLLSTLLPPS